MSPRFVALFAGVGVFALVSFAASPVHAAIQAPCAPATIAPRGPTIPINFPGFGYTALKAPAGAVHLVPSTGGAEVPLVVGPVEGGYLKVKPESALTVGTTYELTFDPFCSYGAFPPEGPLTFTAAAAAPIPTKLGAVRGTPTVRVEDFGTSRVTLTATYDLDGAMTPWSSLYRLGVALNGTTVETKVTVSSARDAASVVATGWCDEAAGKRTIHEVTLRARMPFSPTLETAPVTLTFACPAPALTTPKQGNIEVPNTPPTSPPEGTTNPTSATPAAGSTRSGGCAVSTGAGAPFASVVVGIGLTGLLRRRVARSRRAQKEEK